ncbi:sensor histidine kinase [Roseococcus sp. SDR]|uniref:sensor histidine kinase n=1 Tax=Roseococcus sp. SDR TaxID=2835532 RepID=UPI001BD1AC2C|nr:ATP-binding protein [Roseococcus sp. SDR]MBS7791719.1 sensor histidine kinase [Roseococcus sp. SDR]MBV1847033.1 sensor histidine kinase [Roseococcus sp. SDR]
MIALRGLLSPAGIMLAAAAFCTLCVALVLAAVLSQPWLGLTLAGTPDGGTRILAVAQDGPAARAGLRAGQMVLAVGEGETLRLRADDLMEEPDGHDSYAAYRDFMARQSRLATLLAAPEVALRVATEGDTMGELRLLRAEARPLGALPAVFWVQVASAIGCLTIGAWVWSLRRGDLGALLFALSGLGLFASALSASVYSTRELALDGDLFRALSAMNHFGAYLFGVAMIALFLTYPRPLVRPAALLALPVLFLPLYLANIAHLVETPAQGIHLPVALMMLGIIMLVVLQWVLARRDPVSRAALRWMGLSVVLGAGAFVAAIAVPPLLGREPALSQGYALAFFGLVYAGIALGIRRYRLFDLGTWSFRILFYAAGLLLMVALDAALIMLLNLDQAPAFGIALLAVGFLYLPLRDALARRLSGRRQPEPHEIFAAALDVTFAPTAAGRAERWRGLLTRLFDPLEMEPRAEAPLLPEASADGLEMTLPALANAPPLRLRFPFRGRGLFGPPHLDLVRQLAVLIAEAARSRDAYERGVAEERRRIARDLHDDVGARLLTGLNGAPRETRPLLQAALTDIRAIVSGLSGERVTLDQVLAEMRHEAARRCEGAGVCLDWPLVAPMEGTALEYREAKALTSAMREIVSNMLRHAAAGRFSVHVVHAAGQLTLWASDDGVGFGQPDGAGFGLTNMRQRISELGGSLAIESGPEGTRTTIRLPLPAA